MAQGIIGSVMKPSSALIDAVSTTTIGIGNRFKKKFHERIFERAREPRAFFRDKALLPYNRFAACAQNVINLSRKNVRRDKIYFYSTVDQKNSQLVITDRKIYLLRKKEMIKIKFNNIDKDKINVDELKQIITLRLKNPRNGKRRIEFNYKVNTHDLQFLDKWHEALVKIGMMDPKQRNQLT